MNARLLPTVLFAAGLAACALADDDTGGKTEPKETMRSRLLEDAKAKAAKPAPPAATAAKSDKTDQPAAPASPPAPAPAAKDAATAKAAQEPATVLPKVEVQKSKITEIDREIHQQDQAIAREKEKTKPTELDKALNTPEVSHALRIFGGESAQYKADLAKERVNMMEAEKDILEAMKFAKTKEEKQELQSQLDELRAYRRDLEKNLR